jgi:hypothetical protein
MGLKRSPALLLIACLCATAAHAQVFSNKVVGEKNRALSDSLMHAHYPYILPIWGEKATQRGFSLPYSAGFSLQYFGQRSDLRIDNLNVGFNNGPMYDLTGSSASTRRGRPATVSPRVPTSGCFHS